MSMEYRKILVVDDSETVRLLLAEELEEKGYEIFQAADGQAGRDIAKAENPDLIITDYLMPAMNGYQLAVALRTQDNYEGDIVVMTGTMQQLQSDHPDIGKYVSRCLAKGAEIWGFVGSLPDISKANLRDSEAQEQ